ncbi:aminoacyl-tRNA deacylase [Paenibacillus ihuae]|uniref:aminoacyl-tRNA deacylase n=1 Tax=Paenibacillus ihuae TaxID=1232431 RepID=UPI0006D55D53|nr:YbaK/EbsC family protein [Paenibacillus ihuae]
MLTLEELKHYLLQNDCNFEIIAHQTPIRSTRDAEHYFDIKKAAPTLILQTNLGLTALIASTQRGRLDFGYLKEAFGYTKIKMADKKDVVERTRYSPGAIPLIGHGLPCIFDISLLALDYIYGGSGDELNTLKVAPVDVIRLNNVISFLE